jgi:hypothetical protein
MRLPIALLCIGETAMNNLLCSARRVSIRILAGIAIFVLTACSTTEMANRHNETSAMTLEQTKHALFGAWVSLAPEVRPSARKNADGTLNPFYLSRDFESLGDDRFELTVKHWGDPYGKMELAHMYLRGHISWPGEHPIANGAQKADFVADEAFDVTPMVASYADVFNKIASAGFAPWQPGQTQSVLGKTFPSFGLVEGRNFMEYDLIYIRGNYLFWGARNIDGRGFDKEENRPTNLQIPLIRKSQ